MKPTAVMDIKRTGDFGGEKIAMKIDPNAAAHLMSILTDLYSDAEKAVIREYSTNARDSHIEAGATRPIEVTLPNSMSPYFKVKDFGIGMDTSDIESIYSQYGASTKRGTDTQTGMLGLGCKSALTYTSQFTIVGIKDGIKTTAVVSRVEDGTGVMEIVDTVPTTEGNGVEISVPVKGQNDFNRKAVSFFQFWDEGTVLLNGTVPTRIKGMEVSDNILLVSGGSGLVDSDVIVMGGVPYPVENGLYAGFRSWNGFRIVAFVEIGEVNFTPAREALATSPMTNTTIQRLRTEFIDNLRKQIQDSVESEASHHDARKTYIEWANIVGSAMPAGITYQGEEIQRNFPGLYVLAKSPGYGQKAYKTGAVSDSDIEQSIIVTGFDPEGDITINLRHRKKIEMLAKAKGWSSFSYILCEDIPAQPWVNVDQTVTWDDVKAIKIPNNSKGAAKIPVYDVYGGSGYTSEVEITDIDTKKPIYFHSPKQRYSPNTIKKLTAALGDATLLVMGENRVTKFRREFPKAERIETAVKTLYINAQNALTDKDKTNLGMDYTDKAVLGLLDENSIDDPEIVEGIKIAKGLATTPTLEAYAKATEAYTTAGFYAQSVAKEKAFLSKYPLIRGSYNVDLRHATLYINAVYAANQNGAI